MATSKPQRWVIERNVRHDHPDWDDVRIDDKVEDLYNDALEAYYESYYDLDACHDED